MIDYPQPSRLIPAPVPRRPLWLFLAGSVVIHALLLMWLQWPDNREEWTMATPPPTLHIAIARKHVVANPAADRSPPGDTETVKRLLSGPPVAPSRPRSAPEPTVTKTVPTVEETGEQGATQPGGAAVQDGGKTADRDAHQPVAASPTTNPRPDPRGKEAAPTTSASTQHFDSNQVQAYLLTELKRYIHYPVMARRHGWQGTVLLAFLIEPSGRIGEIEVAESSGFPTLDHSAMEALRKLHQVQQAGNWLNGQTVHMQLPVIYQLTGANSF